MRKHGLFSKVGYFLSSCQIKGPSWLWAAHQDNVKNLSLPEFRKRQHSEVDSTQPSWFWFPSLNSQVSFSCVSSWKSRHLFKPGADIQIHTPIFTEITWLYPVFLLGKEATVSKTPVRGEWLVRARAQSNLLYSVIIHFHTTLWWGIHSPCLITRSCCIWQVCGLDVPSTFLFVILSSEENWSHSSIVSLLHSLITEELSQSCELAPIFAFRENVMPSTFNIYLNWFFFFGGGERGNNAFKKCFVFFTHSPSAYESFLCVFSSTPAHLAQP